MQKVTDLRETVAKFNSNVEATDRDTSFDYCYNYFHTTKDITADMEKGCLVLGFYLASWGMYRGSSFILQRSVKYLEPTIKYIAELKKEHESIWEIDVDKYDEENIPEILKIYEGIKQVLVPEGCAHLTLVTKVLLGVFGFVPAFDQYFCAAFRDITKSQCGFSTMNNNALICIKEFYEKNSKEINELSGNIVTTDFKTGKPTKLHYPKAKIIDMYGFQTGLEKQPVRP